MSDGAATAGVVTIAAGDARLDVAPGVGGAVARFRVGGFDVLRPASREAIAAGDVRGFASYPLVPYSNRIALARLRAGDGVHVLARNFGDHPHAIHGLGWQRAWQVVAHDERRLALGLVHDASGPPARDWPFAFRARQSFALEAARDAVALSMTLGIESEDARAFPFGLGFHPFFPRREGTTLGFRAGGVWQTDETRLPVERTGLPEPWRFDPPRTLGDSAIDNVFTGWDGAATVRWPGERTTATIDADRALSHLVVYVPAGAGHFAVEPVSHMTDAFNRAAAGETGTGARVLPPGAAFSCTMRLTVMRVQR